MALLCLSWVQERLTRVPHKHKQQGFAGIKDDGTVVTWDHVETGGDSSHECVRQGFRSNPILCDGTIVTWGNGDVGGVHDEDQDELDMLYHICARFTHTHTCAHQPFCKSELSPIWEPPLYCMVHGVLACPEFLRCLDLADQNECLRLCVLFRAPSQILLMHDSSSRA